MTRPPGLELPPPFAVAEDSSRYGPLFWVGVGLGWVAISFGVWSLLAKPGATHPPAVAVWVAGLALVHDLFLAPAALLVARLIHRVAPRIARGLVLGALAISGMVALYAFPVMRRFGAQPDNPSFLPRNAGAGLAVVLALVWIVAGAVLARRLHARTDRG